MYISILPALWPFLVFLSFLSLHDLCLFSPHPPLTHHRGFTVSVFSSYMIFFKPLTPSILPFAFKPPRRPQTCNILIDPDKHDLKMWRFDSAYCALCAHTLLFSLKRTEEVSMKKGETFHREVQVMRRVLRPGRLRIFTYLYT